MTAFLTKFDTFLQRVLPHPGGSSPPPGEVVAFGDSSPRDTVLVLDASPSMLESDWKPCRLAGAQKAAKAFADRLLKNEPEARIAVVAYFATANVVLQLTPVRSTQAIHRAIESIWTSGWTNITAGLQAASTLLVDARSNRQIVLLTDGHHNKGFGPRPEAARIRRQAILDCVGIGGTPADVDETLLKRIASTDEHGRKRYRWIGSPEQLVRHFEDLAGGLTRE